MTAKERVQAAIAHRETGVCPYYLPLDASTRQRLLEFSGNGGLLKGLEPYLQHVGPAYPETNGRIDDSHYQDAYGVVWQESVPGELGMANDPVLKYPSLNGYRFPPTRIAGLFDGLPIELAEHAGSYTYWSVGFSLYERAWSLRGMEAFLVDMVTSPAFAHELLDRICEVNLDLIEQACEYPIDCVRFGDDWGAQHGLIMGPLLWRTFIKPRMDRMVDLCHARGKTVFLHSDGDIHAVIPDLVEIGLDILNPVQPDVMDIYSIKREFGQDLTFLGGVSVQDLLPNGSPRQVRHEIRRLMREVGAGGGFIIAPTHTLGADIPVENVTAMIDAFLNQDDP